MWRRNIKYKSKIWFEKVLYDGKIFVFIHSSLCHCNKKKIISHSPSSITTVSSLPTSPLLGEAQQFSKVTVFRMSTNATSLHPLQLIQPIHFLSHLNSLFFPYFHNYFPKPDSTDLRLDYSNPSLTLCLPQICSVSDCTVLSLLPSSSSHSVPLAFHIKENSVLAFETSINSLFFYSYIYFLFIYSINKNIFGAYYSPLSQVPRTEQ